MPAILQPHLCLPNTHMAAMDIASQLQPVEPAVLEAKRRRTAASRKETEDGGTRGAHGGHEVARRDMRPSNVAMRLLLCSQSW